MGVGLETIKSNLKTSLFQVEPSLRRNHSDPKVDLLSTPYFFTPCFDLKEKGVVKNFESGGRF